jgi:hypothetical protein
VCSEPEVFEISHLLPCPYGSERVEETDVFEQVRVQPESRWRGKDCDDEENEPNNGHAEEQSNEAEHAHTKVPHTLSQEERPEGEENHHNDCQKRASSVHLLFPLRSLVQPDVVVVVVCVLVLLDLDCPQALDALRLGVVVALVRIFVDLGDSECEERKRKELEAVLGGGAVVDFGKEGVLRPGFLVCGGLDGADCSLDCVVVKY